jgi:ATP-dependent DNA helicase RecQ
MSGCGQRRSRLRLGPIQYLQLRNQVLRRDGWRCQSCGVMSKLEVHHREFRSRSGNDCEKNLITLCTACHAAVHHGRRNGDRAG